MACSSCGGRSSAAVQYEVTTSQGNTYTVSSVAEARLKINLEAGGSSASSYKAVPKKA